MGVPPLLLNAFIIIICILSYQVFWLERERKALRNDCLISFLASTAIVLCMTFPFHYQSGYIYDLRLIPIIIALLYGGLRSTVIITIIYISYRFYLGGNGFIPSLIVYTMTVTITLIFKYFKPYFKRGKMLFCALIILMCTCAYATFALVNQFKENGNICPAFIHFIINYIVTITLTGLISIYLIEGMIEKYKMKEKIQREEKFYAISELAAAFAHEIRNPLTAVYGFMQLFQKNEIPEKNKDEYMQVMLSELERTQLIIDDYLSLAKTNVLMDKLDISLIVNQVINIISPLATLHNIEVKSSIINSLYINANANKIKQCLINIVKNGIEAMTQGGILQINIKNNDKNIIIEIIDTGIGMTAEEIKRIALPFYSLKEKGTGLGTMIAYGIIKELKGDIQIKSEKGKGTCFSIILPSI
jgi:two-component system sporulation sensor kinase B